MATSFITYTPHGVAESSALLGTEGGAHVLNFKAPANIDNGNFVAYNGFEEGDVWKATYPSTSKDLFLILSSPLIYEEYTPRMQEEQFFFNAEDDIIRGYHLQKYDRFALSAAAFASGATPAVDSYLTFSGSSYQAGVTTTKPQSGAILRIYDVATNGLFRVVVEDIA